jgi:hypothetical protein
MTSHRSATPAPEIADDHPSGPTPGWPHGTVRLIPMGEAQPLIDGQQSDRLSPERNLRLAHQHLAEARVRVAGAKSELEIASRVATDAHDQAEQAKVAYERSRFESRRAELALRRQQRNTDEAKLALRQAYEQVAHLEGLPGSPVIDLTG